MYPHYSRYHPELIINEENTIKLRNVISAVTLRGSTDINLLGDTETKIGYGDDGPLKAKLESLWMSARRESVAKKPIQFGSIPRFDFTLDLARAMRSLEGTGSAMATATDSAVGINEPNMMGDQTLNLNCETGPDPMPYSMQKKKQTVLQRVGSRSERKQTAARSKEQNDSVSTMPHVATGAPLMIRGGGNEPNYQWIIDSVKKFESNRHDLSRLLSDDMIPSDVSQCQSLIKVLFEQLWNSRAICDEQMMCIEYHNVIDAGNRMQISFILNALKKNHSAIYRDLYRQLQNDPDWRKWKEMRLNDRKINDLRLKIERIRRSEEILRRRKRRENESKISDLQMETILNLKDAQSAHTQRYGLSLKRVSSELTKNKKEDTDRDRDSKLKGKSSVDDILASSVVENNIERLRSSMPGNRPSMEMKQDGPDEDDEKWMETIKRFLGEFEGEMDLAEIKEKLADSRYCSEFDVLNDILQLEHGNAQHIKSRFCSYFGNLVDWGYKRLISWCQTNKFYNLCQKIRSKKVCGRTFIQIVTNINSVKRFFNNLTSPQVIQLYNRINHYFEDSLSIF